MRLAFLTLLCALLFQGSAHAQNSPFSPGGRPICPGASPICQPVFVAPAPPGASCTYPFTGMAAAPAHAYAFDKVVSGFAGSASVRVRLTGGSSTTIGFKADGCTFDNVAFTLFCTSTADTCAVEFFDQAGSDDFVNTTFATAPKAKLGCSTLNTQACTQTDGSTTFLATASTTDFNLTGDRTVLMVFNLPNSNTGGSLLGASDPNSPFHGWILQYGQNTAFDQGVYSDGNGHQNCPAGTVAIVNNGAHLAGFLVSGTTLTCYLDGTAANSGITFTSQASNVAASMFLEAGNGAVQGDFALAAVWSSALSTGDRAILRTFAQSKWGTP
jgi:hypothetical protein